MSGTLAVISQTGESLSFFDLASGSRVAQIPSVISEPHELCLDPKRAVLYMSHTYRHGHYWKHGENSHEISVVDVNDRKVVDIIDTRPGRAPHGLAIDHERDILYASVEELPNEAGGGIIGIDLATRKVIKSIPSQHRSHWFTMTPDGKKAYTCNKDADFISVIDLEREIMTGKISVPSTEEPSMSRDGRFAYFPTPGLQFGKNPAEPEIKVIDTANDTIVKSIKTDWGSISTYVMPSGDMLVGQYSYSEDAEKGKTTSASLAIYDGDSHQCLGRVPIGLLPLTLRSSNDSKLAFTANVADGTVSVVDIASKVVIRTLTVDEIKRQDKLIQVRAHGMAFIP